MRDIIILILTAVVVTIFFWIIGGEHQEFRNTSDIVCGVRG